MIPFGSLHITSLEYEGSEWIGEDDLAESFPGERPAMITKEEALKFMLYNIGGSYLPVHIEDNTTLEELDDYAG